MAEEKPKKATKGEIKALRGEAEGILKKIQTDTLGLYQPAEEKPLGDGAFNVVHRSKQTIEVRRIIDEKKSENTQEPLVISKPKQELKSYEREVILASKKRSQNILNSTGLFSPSVINPLYTSRLGKQVSLRAKGGNLLQLFNGFQQLENKTGKKMPVELAKQIVGQIILTLELLHSRGIAYRDLKPENILLLEKFDLKKWEKADPKAKPVVQIALCDIESVERVNERGELVSKETEMVGSDQYMHPDINDIDGYYTLNHRKGDLYSYGRIVEMFIGFKSLKGEKYTPLLDPKAPEFALFQELHETLCQEKRGKDLDAIPDITEVDLEEPITLANGKTIRHTVSQYTALRDHRLFGDTSQERVSFLNNLRPKREIISGGFNIGHPVEMDDPFNLIPAKMKRVYDQFHALTNRILHILSYRERGGQTDISLFLLLTETYENKNDFDKTVEEYRKSMQGSAEGEIVQMEKWIKSAMGREPFPQAQEQLKIFKPLGDHFSFLREQSTEIRKLIRDKNIDSARGELASFKTAAKAFPAIADLFKKQCPLFAGDIAAMQQSVKKTAEDLRSRIAQYTSLDSDDVTATMQEGYEAVTETAEGLSNHIYKRPPSKWPKRLFKLYQYASFISGIAAAVLVGLSIISGPIGWAALAALAAVVLTTNVYLSTGRVRMLSRVLLYSAIGACVVMGIGLLITPVGWMIAAVILPIVLLTVWTGVVNYRYSQQMTKALEDNRSSQEEAFSSLHSALQPGVLDTNHRDSESTLQDSKSSTGMTEATDETQSLLGSTSGNQVKPSISSGVDTDSSSSSNLGESKKNVPNESEEIPVSRSFGSNPLTAPPNSQSFLNTASNTRRPSTPNSQSILSTTGEGQGLADSSQRNVVSVTPITSPAVQESDAEVSESGATPDGTPKNQQL